ncbi:LOG family protein [Desulfonatronum thiodismutans]|uniref:LOG family protein n=1 Tax=Desulfonatronum thiodismutans TaxID=159290 RepID=UPI0004ABE2AE|nr:TIGR00730 family Rossman fold protein [Desulfonatronum thiodismutans]
MAASHPETLFPSAQNDVARAQQQPSTPQTESAAYRLAFLDKDFILQDELRPVRLQLELLKPEMLMRDSRIESTVVVFGSARLLDAETAQARLDEALAAVGNQPDGPEDKGAKARLQAAKSALEHSRYYEEARKLSRIISENCQCEEKKTHVVITGGGPGIMEAANRGAAEVQAKSIGLNIVLPHEQAPNPYITPELSFQFHYFAIRKMHFLIRARALVVFPGGFGTLDELFDALTLIQTGKIAPMPVLLFGSQFWKKVINFEALVEAGTVSPHDLDLFEFVETADEAWDRIAAFDNLERKY